MFCLNCEFCKEWPSAGDWHECNFCNECDECKKDLLNYQR